MGRRRALTSWFFASGGVPVREEEGSEGSEKGLDSGGGRDSGREGSCWTLAWSATHTDFLLSFPFFFSFKVIFFRVNGHIDT